MLLQLGAIDLQSGRWDAAEGHFEAADRAFPGWWLARAHLGQMAASRGDLDRAESLYLEAMEGAERPSVMDALAAVYAGPGRSAEAAAMAERAGKLWKARVASHPAAYADHAFEAFLAEGDTAQAWQLARLNYVTRPYGDGRIGLARAAALRGRDASARAILEELERTGWRSTEQYRVLAEVCKRLGDEACAEDAREKALAISPLAFDERNGLHFFSNH
jgi:tetratricopeptide (TPR) repeat protein